MEGLSSLEGLAALEGSGGLVRLDGYADFVRKAHLKAPPVHTIPHCLLQSFCSFGNIILLQTAIHLQQRINQYYINSELLDDFTYKLLSYPEPCGQVTKPGRGLAMTGSQVLV